MNMQAVRLDGLMSLFNINRVCCGRVPTQARRTKKSLSACLAAAFAIRAFKTL